MGSLAQRYFAAGTLLAILAVIRLLLLLASAGETNPRSRPIRLDTEIRLKVHGARGETIRLFFPEVPLSLDAPFNDEQVRIPVSLAVGRRPGSVTVQVLKEGKVAAVSRPLRMAEGSVLDLGTVEVQSP